VTASAPLVSVVLPVFNRLKYLRQAVESVFAQTLTDWELIIADDGSDAETRAYLSALANPPRVRIVRLEHSGNYSTVRNAALREAKGEYVAFLDSDDLWLPEKLALQVEALRTDGARRWNYTGHRCIDGDGNAIRLPAVAEWVPHCGAISEQILRDRALVCTPAVVAARDLITRAGGFDEEQPLYEDYDLWLRLLMLSEIGVVDRPLVCVRKHEQNTCGGGSEMLIARDRMLGKLHGLVADPTLRRTIGQLRAVNIAHLAAVYANTERVRALVTLFSLRRSWRHAAWWVRVPKVLLKLALPRRLLDAYRSSRGSSVTQAPSRTSSVAAP
jgi:hypothetical protein